MCVLYGGFFPPIYGRTEEQAAKNHCGISGLWDGVCGGGSAFHFRLAVHGDCAPAFDGRRQMAVLGEETGFFVRHTVLLYQGYGQADNGKPVLSFQWENRAGAGQ